MNARLLVCGIAFSIAVGAFTFAALAENVRPVPGTPGAQRPWLSTPQVHQTLEAAGYGNIEKIEREHGNYEVKATDRNGERVKLHVNPQTGEVLDSRLRDAKAGRARQDGQRPGVECSKRRCRDDLPPPAGAAPQGN